MQFRCYTCAFVFHDGPPPLEALSDHQFDVVQGIPRPEVTNFQLMVLGTQLEGLTPHNLCTSCLASVVDNPTAFTLQAQEGHDLDQTPNAIWCTCGTTYWTSTGDRSFKGKDFYSTGPDWVEVNRLRMRHLSDEAGR